MTVRNYLLSLPERFLRSTLGLGAGVAREIGEVTLPKGVRRTHLYQGLVDTTLRFLIERVGGAEGVYPDETKLCDDFLTRRAAGNAIEVLGVVAFRASPVWVLAALADVCGIGRTLVPEIADELKTHGLLDEDAQFVNVDQMLDGLERTSARLAETINTPPLDVATLREEWQALRDEARTLQPDSLPSADALRDLWSRLRTESLRHDRSVFETSTVLAVSAAQRLPAGILWFSTSARLGASRTSRLAGAALLEHYTRTLDEIREVGYATYTVRQLRPYVRAAIHQFSPERRTLTERVIGKKL